MRNDHTTESQAIEAALAGNWEKAEELNTAILQRDAENLPAHLRLGYALLQLDKLQEASEQYKKVLTLQPKHNIAEEHLAKISILLQKNKKRGTRQAPYEPSLFLEIPGKTRTVHLVNLGQKEDLAGVNVGQEVFLHKKRRKLEVRTTDDDYLGSLPDDISKRLTYFIQEGSQYRAYIKESDFSTVVLFIREISKGTSVRQYPSFPANPHVMLSDIGAIGEDGTPKSEDGTPKADDDEEDEEDGEGGNLELDDEDDSWDEYEEEKDLSSIVQLEDSDDEEEE